METHWEAIVCVVDIRGFTALSENRKASEQLPRFLYDFFDQLITAVLRAGIQDSDYKVKPTGDGAILVVNWGNAPFVALKHVLAFIDTFETRHLPLLSEDYSNLYNVKFDLKLGWGISKGRVRFMGADYLGDSGLGRPYTENLRKVFPEGATDFFGAEVNKAAKLCGLARPHGIVLDGSEFPAFPSDQVALVPFESEVSGFGKCFLYVSEAIAVQAKINGQQI